MCLCVLACTCVCKFVSVWSEWVSECVCGVCVWSVCGSSECVECSECVWVCVSECVECVCVWSECVSVWRVLCVSICTGNVSMPTWGNTHSRKWKKKTRTRMVTTLSTTQSATIKHRYTSSLPYLCDFELITHTLLISDSCRLSYFWAWFTIMMLELT